MAGSKSSGSLIGRWIMRFHLGTFHSWRSALIFGNRAVSSQKAVVRKNICYCTGGTLETNRYLVDCKSLFSVLSDGQPRPKRHLTGASDPCHHHTVGRSNGNHCRMDCLTIQYNLSAPSCDRCIASAVGPHPKRDREAGHDYSNVMSRPSWQDRVPVGFAEFRQPHPILCNLQILVQLHKSAFHVVLIVAMSEDIRDRLTISGNQATARWSDTKSRGRTAFFQCTNKLRRASRWRKVSPQ
jgi:hypothetical protein